MRGKVRLPIVLWAGVAAVGIAVGSSTATRARAGAQPPLSAQARIGPTDHSARVEAGGPLAARLRAHIGFLADDAMRGRETGSREYEIAARYVAAQFQLLGLEPAAPEGGWFQRVPLRGSRLVEGSAAITLHTADGDVELQWLHDFRMGGDAFRTESEVTAPVVFAGWGISAPELGHEDYAGLDIEGCIVAIFRGAPARFPHNQRAFYSRNKSEEAAARGAVGVLTLQTREEQRRVPWERLIRNPYRMGMEWLNEAGEVQGEQPEIQGDAYLSPRGAETLFAHAPHSLESVLDAAERDTAAGFELPVRATLRRKTVMEETSASNVVARLPGADAELAGEAVVFTAHLDHIGVGAAKDGDEIYNGAYDNATGVATLIETARLFKEGEAPRRTVLFVALAGEEKGLLGARYFAHHPPMPVGELVADVNLDMPLFLYPLADLVAFGAEHSSLHATVATAAAEYGLALSPDPMPEQVIFVRSDQYAFVEEGVPAIFLVPGFGSRDSEVDGGAVWREFFNQHYHMPSDDLSLPFDGPSAERFTLVNHRIGLALANATARPTWNPGDFFGERFGQAAAAAAGAP